MHSILFAKLLKLFVLLLVATGTIILGTVRLI